jgi:hypothetical protein
MLYVAFYFGKVKVEAPRFFFKVAYFIMRLRQVFP